MGGGGIAGAVFCPPLTLCSVSDTLLLNSLIKIKIKFFCAVYPLPPPPPPSHTASVSFLILSSLPSHFFISYRLSCFLLFKNLFCCCRFYFLLPFPPLILSHPGFLLFFSFSPY